MTERVVSTSISIEPSKLNKLREIALQKGYKSRNELIYKILINWLEKENKSKKGCLVTKEEIVEQCK